MQPEKDNEKVLQGWRWLRTFLSIVEDKDWIAVRGVTQFARIPRPSCADVHKSLVVDAVRHAFACEFIACRTLLKQY